MIPSLPQPLSAPRSDRLVRPARRLPGLLLAVCALLLAGCIDVPELDARLGETDADAPYPRLVPAERILQAANAGTLVPETQESLQDRVTALNQRADNLRGGGGLDEATRARMQAGVTRPLP